MSWKQILEVKPEVGTAVDVATSGDPCCETARDKFIEALLNFEATYAKHLPMPPTIMPSLKNSSCEELAAVLDGTISTNAFRPLTLELIEIRNEWIECDGSNEPLHAIPVE